MRYLILFIIVFSVGVGKAQVAIGEWEEYLSYSKVHSVTRVGSKIFAASEVGLYSYDVKEGVIEKYNKINGLSDIGISSIASIPNENSVFIGYENGNIDILQNGKVSNIPDLKNKTVANSKRINHIDFIDDRAYCATDFGILVVNYRKKEISDFYNIGDEASIVKVNQIAHNGDSIYAATEKGLRGAPIGSNQLTFYEHWKYLLPSSINVKSVIALGEKIYVVATKDGVDWLSERVNNGFVEIIKLNNFVKLKKSNEDYFIVEKNKVRLYTSANIIKETVNAYNIDGSTISPNFTSAEIDNLDDLYLGDSKIGMVKTSKTEGYINLLPDGPQSNRCLKLLAVNGDLWSVPGPFHYVVPETYPAECNIFTKSGWIRLNTSVEPYFEKKSNICDVVVDPTNSKIAYLASARDGIFELENYKVVNFYNLYNSAVQGVFNWDHPWNLINGISIDPNGNLFANNQAAKYPVIVKPKGVTSDPSKVDFGWYKYQYMPYVLETHKDYEKNQPWFHQMLYTSWGDVWSISGYNPNGLFIFRHNGTLDDESDDLYRAPKNDFTDSRNSLFKLWDEEGKEIVSQPQCFAEDKNGYIWVGLANGVVVYYRPRSVFDISKPVALKVTIPRNDGSDLADYLLEDKSVTAIAIDEANRKWIGTLSDGVFFVSADGTQIIDNFNISNCPLISNTINSIDIDDNSGKVYIATDKGIVSYMGTAITGSSNYNSIDVYPNPVRPEYNGLITIKGLLFESNVKITDVSGNIVYEAESTGGQIVWDGRNFDGDKVKTGVYLIYAASPDGNVAGVGKVMIVR